MPNLRERLQSGLGDRYRLERELGRGGMATVFLALDLRHERPVALKLLHPELASSLGPERFLREVKLAARLQHPHILSVHDSGETGWSSCSGFPTSYPPGGFRSIRRSSRCAAIPGFSGWSRGHS